MVHKGTQNIEETIFVFVFGNKPTSSDIVLFVHVLLLESGDDNGGIRRTRHKKNLEKDLRGDGTVPPIDPNLFTQTSKLHLHRSNGVTVFYNGYGHHQCI